MWVLTGLPGVEVLKTLGLITDWCKLSINADSNGLQYCTLFYNRQQDKQIITCRTVCVNCQSNETKQISHEWHFISYITFIALIDNIIPKHLTLKSILNMKKRLTTEIICTLLIVHYKCIQPLTSKLSAKHQCVHVIISPCKNDELVSN